MFAPLAARSLPRLVTASRTAAAAPAASRAASSSSSVGALAYQLVFKRNVVYLSFIFAGAIVLDGVYGSAMKGLWRSMNKGRTFGACALPRPSCFRPLFFFFFFVLRSPVTPAFFTSACCALLRAESIDWTKWKTEDE